MSQPYSQDHLWVAATTITLKDNLARQADRRGTVRIPETTKVDVLDVYCEHCRRPYDAVAGQACIAATEKGREHLIGGPTGERKKRKHNHDCALVGCDVTTTDDHDEAV